MPLLAYCITETAAVALIQNTGVNDCPIESVEHDGLRCFVSESADTVQLPTGSIRDVALVFHRVLEGIFQQAAIIPFRFPTILAGEAEVIAYLREHSAEYHAALTRFRDMVQMEIRIELKDSRFPGKLAESTFGQGHDAKPSGTEYLRKIQGRRERLEIAAKKFQQACARLTKAWRQRDSIEGMRCFLLIERASVKEFQGELQGVEVGTGLVARLSGPWPASQFLKEE